MHCKNCHYALWNLPSRTCPECGTHFAPSEFEFRPNAVKFCCPQCTQEYYGTSPIGHLEPRSFNCVRCQTPIDMDQMVLLPAAGVSEETAVIEHRNWPHRARVGIVRSWFISVGQSMAMPGRLIGAAAPDKLSEAWWFSTFTQLVVFGFYALLSAVFVGGMMLAFGGFSARGGGGPPALFFFGFCGGAAVGGILVCQLYFLITACVAHLVLRASGSTAHAFGRTLQCAFYASGPMVLAGLPCVGQYTSFIGFIWATVSFALMLIPGQRVSGGRAAIAAITTPAFIFLLGVGLIMLSVFSANSPTTWSSTTRTPTLASSSTGIWSATSAVVSRLDSARPFTHPVQLLIDRDIMPYDVIVAGGVRSPKQVPVGFSNAQDVMFLPLSEQQRLITNVTAAVPAGAGEIKLGDLVFPIVNQVNDPELWVVILDPRTSGPAGSIQSLQVGKRNGQVVTLNVNIAKAYAEQNARRATAGLPALAIPPAGGIPTAPTAPEDEDP